MAVTGKTDELVTIEPTIGLRVLLHWLAQPYFLPLTHLRQVDPELTTAATIAAAAAPIH